MEEQLLLIKGIRIRNFLIFMQKALNPEMTELAFEFENPNQTFARLFPLESLYT